MEEIDFTDDELDALSSVSADFVFTASVEELGEVLKDPALLRSVIEKLEKIEIFPPVCRISPEVLNFNKRSSTGRKNKGFHGGGGSNRVGANKFVMPTSVQPTEKDLDVVKEAKRLKTTFLEAIQSGKMGALEDEIAGAFGRAFALRNKIENHFLTVGVDIPVPAIVGDGEILKDDNDNPVLIKLVHQTSSVAVYGQLNKALGIDVNSSLLSPESRGTKPPITSKDALDDVESSMDELQKARRKKKN